MKTMEKNAQRAVGVSKAGALANIFPTGGGKVKSKDSTSTAGTINHKAKPNRVLRKG